MKAQNDASPEIKKFRDDVDKATKDIKSSGDNALTDFAGKLGLSADQAAKLGAALPLVGAAAAGLATAVVVAGAGIAALGVGMFRLAQNAAETASEIDKFQKLTNLSVGSVQSLKYAAESVGDSLETITEIWESFSELIIDAARGNEDAVKKLTQNGINAKTAVQDLEGTFKQALKTINDAPAGFRQNAVAMDLMGESGLDIIPILRSFNGDLDALTKKLTEQGVVMDAEGIRKAKEFGKAYGELTHQISGLANLFATQYAPQMTGALKSISKSLTENKDAFLIWGEMAGSALNGFYLIGKVVFQFVSTVLTRVASDLKMMTLGLIDFGSVVDTIYGRFEQRVAAKNKQAAEKAAAEEAAKAAFLAAGGKLTDTKPWTPEDADKQAEKASQERQKKLDLAIRGFEQDADIAKQAYENRRKILDELLKAEKTTLADYKKEIDDELTKWYAAYYKSFKEREALLASRFKGQELISAQKALQAEKSGIIAQHGAETLKVENDVGQRRIKIKETEIKTTLEFEKARGDKELALLLDNADKYARAKEAQTIHLLETEQKLLRGFLADKSLEIPESKRLEIVERGRILTEEVERAKTEAAINETKRRLAITDKLEEEAEDVSESRKQNDIERERAKSEIAIKSGKNKLAALQGLFDYEKTLAEEEKNSILEKLIEEERARLKSIEGFEDEQNLKFQIEELYKQKRLLAEEEFQRRLSEIKKQFEPNIEQEQFNSIGGGLFGGLFGGLGLTVEEMTKPVEILSGLGDMLANTFNKVADAVGQAVHNFVLFGSAGTSFRKFAAEVIASIAQMAIVSALWELAQGLAMSALAWFTGNPKFAKSAADHYLAAGVYAAIGGVAAVAGRGLAGNAFQGNQAASGQNTGGFGSQTRSGQGGEVYTSRPETQIIDASRNASQSIDQRIILQIDSKNGLPFDEFFTARMMSNGKIRDAIRREAY